MKNRLNDLDSKTYMKFLKSWSIYNENTLHDFIYFFTKAKDENAKTNSVGIWGINDSDKNKLLESKRCLVDLKTSSSQNLSYVLIDLRKQSLQSEKQTRLFFKETLEPLLKILLDQLKEKCYISIFCSNFKNKNSFFPSAWMIGKLTAQHFEMKDEKLICCDAKSSNKSSFPITGDKSFFALNFRHTRKLYYSDRSVFILSNTFLASKLKPWFILKPPPRKEKVKLHPAKFPEILIEQFIRQHSDEDDNIFDPMSGTGSTQIAALDTKRNAYGCEITDHFHEIAMDRLSNLNSLNQFFLARDDAYNFDKYKQFPKEFDYILTSPPYWDMLNMDGAETQKSRVQNGLMVNYSDLDTDLGNCADYDIFLAKLLKIYNKVLLRLKSGGHFTIIIKNIKKKGTIYTFAWDLVEKLSVDLSLANINYWLQDDIRLAPYGYGNAWVSNTFHQYCLTFKKL